MDNSEIVFAAEHFAVVQGIGRTILGSHGHYRRPTSDHNAAAKMSERQPSVGEASVLQ
jgi:hypothetical protein